MNDQLSMFVQTTFEDTTSTIFSPESADGAMPSDSQDGTTSEPSGQEAALVSRFRARDSSEAMPTADTSGPLFTHSSPSANLQQSLENRLRANLAESGYPQSALTWKTLDMPAGPPISRLLHSGVFIEDIASGLWPTPESRMYRDLNRQNRVSPGGLKRHQPSSVTTAYARRFLTAQIPALLCGLMGFPIQWVQCAVSATRLSRKSHQNSSRQQRKNIFI